MRPSRLQKNLTKGELTMDELFFGIVFLIAVFLMAHAIGHAHAAPMSAVPIHADKMLQFSVGKLCV